MISVASRVEKGETEVAKKKKSGWKDEASLMGIVVGCFLLFWFLVFGGGPSPSSQIHHTESYSFL